MIRSFGILVIELSILGPAFCRYQSAPSALSSSISPKAYSITHSFTLESDTREKRLSDYLSDKNSPLTSYAPTFIKIADENNLDWRLLPAISGVESGYGRVQLEGSYNPFGWGGGYLYLDSWEEGIRTVALGIKTNWIDRNLTTPEQIAPFYCPPNSNYWATSVTSLMKEIDTYLPQETQSISMLK